MSMVRLLRFETPATAYGDGKEFVVIDTTDWPLAELEKEYEASLQDSVELFGDFVAFPTDTALAPW